MKILIPLMIICMNLQASEPQGDKPIPTAQVQEDQSSWIPTSERVYDTALTVVVVPIAAVHVAYTTVYDWWYGE